MRANTTRWIWMILIVVTFEIVNFRLSLDFTTLTPYQWALMCFAASTAGRALAYLPIFEWLRAPLCRVIIDPSGNYVEPKYHAGFRGTFGALISCPICSGTWAGLVLLIATTFKPEFGWTLVYSLSIAGGAWLISRITELIERS